MKILTIYASKNGATKEICEFIKESINCDLCNCAQIEKDLIAKYDGFIIATPSYGFAELCDCWKKNLKKLKDCEIDKKVALLGTGGIKRHSNSFCGALVDFLPALKRAEIIGQTEEKEYKFTHSPAFINGKFIGLCVDFKDDSNWKDRVRNWVLNLEF